MSIIMSIQRHPAFCQVECLARDVLKEHTPEAFTRSTTFSESKLTLELYRFLAVKQLVLRTGRSESEEDSLQVSPGFLIDALWHAVLLESEARVALDALLGGHVPHSAADARYLTDEEKLARQLTALNLMALEGWTPDLFFWQQPGTAMHKVEQVQSNGLTLFFARGMPVRDVAEVTRNFLSSVGQSFKMGAFIAAVDAALAAAADAGAGAAGGSRRGRRAAVAPAANTYVPPGSIMLNVTTLTGKSFSVAVPGQGTVAHIMHAIAECEGIPTDWQRLIYNGERLNPYGFVEEAGVANGATLHLVLRLAGC